MDLGQKFFFVEWHYPNRVLRQFGFIQPIPHPPFRFDELHETTLRDHDTNWEEKHAQWIEHWGRRAHNVMVGEVSHGFIHYHSQYLEWYRSVTRRWISPMSARLGVAVRILIYFVILYRASFFLKYFINLFLSNV